MYTCADGHSRNEHSRVGEGVQSRSRQAPMESQERGEDAGAIPNATLVWEGENILWVGREADLPELYKGMERVDANGMMAVPGFVDCHTHLCFGGWRADEFEMRIRGRSYLEIAKAGGGILSTMRATREATEEELFEKAAGLLEEIRALGVTAIECKSGYGLSIEAELKQLRVYKRLRDRERERGGMRIVSTFLGAHTVPPEYKENRRGYLDLVIGEMIPQVAEEGLADFCDIFVEESAFTVEEAREVLLAGKKAGLRPKVHADQLSAGGGAELAAEVGAVSADHLEHISRGGIRAMAEAGVVAVTLPIASLYTQQPFLNARPLADAGVRVAVATDFNPGSAPSFDLPLAMMLACNQSRLTPAEALKGATLYAAQAIGLEQEIGSLEPGKSADFLLLNAKNVNEWMYHYKGSRLEVAYLRGVTQPVTST
ncbi:MAG: imidazolonepropionase [Bacteroidetes bacterium]|nr:MAG: imidazolonepropionase [Bacteroidota bacterium]